MPLRLWESALDGSGSDALAQPCLHREEMPGGLLDTGYASAVLLLPAFPKGYGVHSTINIGLCLVLFGVSIAWPGSGHISIPLGRGDTVVLCFGYSVTGAWEVLGSCGTTQSLSHETVRTSEVGVHYQSLYWGVGNLLDS